MATVNTVLGPIDSTELGFTLSHDHVLGGPPGAYRDYPELFGTNLLERAAESLKTMKQGGIDTFIDATTPDLGRDVNLLKEASRLSGVKIIASTGWWMDIPRFFTGLTADRLAALFIRDIERGISGTDSKAGVIKAASDIAGVTPAEELILRAAARAHRSTGVPIMLHSYSPGRVGQRQLAILQEEGVKPNRVKMDHSNDTVDLEYLTWLLEQGCYLGLDRYPGFEPGISVHERNRVMKTLIEAGYGGRLCPGHDLAILEIFAPDQEKGAEEKRKRNPHGHLYIKKVVFPKLAEMGVPQADIDRLCIEGPRNFFEGK